MPDHPLSAPVARPAAALVAVVLLTIWTVLAASPAVAHDRLLASDPADGAVLEEAPGAVVLTFSSDQLPVGAAVVVRDAAGTDRADGAPDVSGATVTQALQADLPAGAYAVQWRSVSADGHPVEGAFSFEVGGAVGAEAPGPADVAPTEGPPAQRVDEGPPPAEDVAAAGEGVDDGAGGAEEGRRGPVLAGAALAVLAVGVVLAVRRSTRAGDVR